MGGCRVSDYGPVVVTDACGAGNVEAGARAIENLRFLGDAMLTEAAPFRAALGAPS